MLLCDAHHRLIDSVAVESHPVELLRRYKQEHEERIERQTAIQASRRTHILLFGTRIGDRQGGVNYDQACQAVLPERYPADEHGLRLDLADNEVSELDPEFWAQTARYVERRLHRLLRTAGHGEAPLNHLSIFALAPIPAVIDFGKRVGDIISADVYQRQRSTGDWRWQDLADMGFDYRIDRPAPDRRSGSRVALNLSLSDVIHSAAIERAMGGPSPTYKLTIARPRRDFLRAKEQLELFRNEWYALLSEIREAHGEDCELHVFPAVPFSVAVEIGRSLLPKSDPQLVVYDFNKGCGGFQRAIAV